ncbi:MAG: UDP-galactopyranose mutase [Puniceicoccales bacterium]|jgi:UDP-galactopyranose mutase|nr:UDP-galactopyranose mutase [Puniceicoccales bacterium]
MFQYDTIVIGAGFSGAVFAREMADAGKRVLLIERRSHIGGNMFEEDSPAGVRIHKYGPHIFHTNNPRVFEYLQRFGKWFPYEHRVLGRIDGKLVPIPFNFKSVDVLFPEEKAVQLKRLLLENFGKDKRVSIYDLANHSNAEIREFGAYVLDRVFLHYTAKQWGVPIEQVDKSTINRVPVVTGYDDRYFQDEIQWMPEEGFTKIFERMLGHENITLRLGTDARTLLRLDHGTKKVFFEGVEFSGTVFFSGAIDEFLDCRHGRLPYRSVDLVFEDLDMPQFQAAAVVNYPNEEKFTRISEFKYFHQK